MSTQTVQTAGVAAVPRVNLLPPEIAEAARFRRLQLAMGGAVVASAVIVGGLYLHSKSGVSSAEASVTAAQTQQSSLQGKLASLQSVKDTYAAVQTKQQLLSQAMGTEIRWSYVLNDLSFRLPSNVWLTAISASESTVPGAPVAAAPATSTPATGVPGIGNVTFTGVGMKHDDVATWLDALAREKGFTEPTFSNSAESVIGSRNVVDFASSAVVTDQALSNRYTTKAEN